MRTRKPLDAIQMKQKQITNRKSLKIWQLNQIKVCLSRIVSCDSDRCWQKEIFVSIGLWFPMMHQKFSTKVRCWQHLHSDRTKGFYLNAKACKCGMFDEDGVIKIRSLTDDIKCARSLISTHLLINLISSRWLEVWWSFLMLLIRWENNFLLYFSKASHEKTIFSFERRFLQSWWLQVCFIHEMMHFPKPQAITTSASFSVCEKSRQTCNFQHEAETRRELRHKKVKSCQCT